MVLSMVIIDGRLKVTDEMKKQYVDACNVKLIKLVHGSGFGEGSIPVSGFQHVNISITENQGKKTFFAKYFKDREGVASNCGRSLTFDPDPITSQLTAYLPDTEYNRIKLARGYYHGADWKIDDQTVDAEIKAMADKFEINLPVSVSKEEVITDQQRQINELNEKLKVAESKLAIKTVADDIVKTSKSKVVKKEEEWEYFGIAKGKYDAIKKQAREEIFQENQEALDVIKAKYGKGWFACKEYEEKILPIVKDRLKEKLNALNVPNSIAS